MSSARILFGALSLSISTPVLYSALHRTSPISCRRAFCSSLVLIQTIFFFYLQTLHLVEIFSTTTNKTNAENKLETTHISSLFTLNRGNSYDVTEIPLFRQIQANLYSCWSGLLKIVFQSD